MGARRRVNDERRSQRSTPAMSQPAAPETQVLGTGFQDRWDQAEDRGLVGPYNGLLPVIAAHRRVPYSKCHHSPS